MSETPTVLARRRGELGWTRYKLVTELEAIGRERGLAVPARESLLKAVTRHERGHSKVTDRMYIELYCAVYDASTHELFGDLDGYHANGTVERTTVVCHRFAPVFVGPDQVGAAARKIPHVDADIPDAPGTWKADVDHPRGRCTLYGLPWGCLVYHLASESAADSITDLAIERQKAHRAEPKWAAQHLQSLLDTPKTPGYVLTAFWVTDPRWRGPELDIAMRLLCRPRTLLEDGSGQFVESIEHARLVEDSLLKHGFEDAHQISFGIPGASIGYASWSGVAYYPLSAKRALNPKRFIEFEVVAQGLWTWCAHIRDQAAGGLDPVPPEGYGWRWLRGTAMRLTTPKPQETSQEKLMREAVMRSSTLAGDFLPAVLDILRDVPGE